MIGGALAYKFIVVPAVDKFRAWNESRKIKAQEHVTVIDATFEETEDESEE